MQNNLNPYVEVILMYNEYSVDPIFMGIQSKAEIRTEVHRHFIKFLCVTKGEGLINLSNAKRKL
jgi:hypothetical protein